MWLARWYEDEATCGMVSSDGEGGSVEGGGDGDERGEKGMACTNTLKSMI